MTQGYVLFSGLRAMPENEALPMMHSTGTVLGHLPSLEGRFRGAWGNQDGEIPLEVVGVHEEFSKLREEAEAALGRFSGRTPAYAVSRAIDEIVGNATMDSLLRFVDIGKPDLDFSFTLGILTPAAEEPFEYRADGIYLAGRRRPARFLDNIRELLERHGMRWMEDAYPLTIRQNDLLSASPGTDFVGPVITRETVPRLPPHL